MEGGWIKKSHYYQQFRSPCASPRLDHLQADGEEQGGGGEKEGEERIKEGNVFQNAKTKQKQK